MTNLFKSCKIIIFIVIIVLIIFNINNIIF